MHLYSEGLKGSKNLFESLFASSEEIKAGSLNYSFYILNSKSIPKRNKAQRVFLNLLNSKHVAIQNEYSHAFLDFSPKIFSDIYKLLLIYCKNRNTHKRESYNLYEYLLKCMDMFPKECINLTEYLILSYKINPAEFYSTEEPIKLLIGSYNKLKEYKLKNTFTEKAMDIFDKIIQIPNFRYTTNKVLAESEYS